MVRQMVQPLVTLLANRMAAPMDSRLAMGWVPPTGLLMASSTVMHLETCFGHQSGWVCTKSLSP